MDPTQNSAIDLDRMQPVRETKQDRSRRTLERILLATEDLLKDRDFDAITMADLAKRAGCAVGTLYGRVPNKESLLACLFERQSKAAEILTRKLFESCEGGDLDTRVRAVCEFVIDHCAAQRGSIRATTAHLFERPGGDVYGFRKQITKAFRMIASLLAEVTDDPQSDATMSTCEFGLLAVCDVAQSRVVFGDRSGVRLRYSRRELKERLSALLLAYLRSPV